MGYQGFKNKSSRTAVQKNAQSIPYFEVVFCIFLSIFLNMDSIEYASVFANNLYRFNLIKNEIDLAKNCRTLLKFLILGFLRKELFTKLVTLNRESLFL